MATEFYSLPAHELRAGMSTADGQDILDDIWFDHEKRLIIYHTYTPRPDDLDQDAENQGMTDGRVSSWDEPVDLAVFDDTVTDGRRLA